MVVSPRYREGQHRKVDGSAPRSFRSNTNRNSSNFFNKKLDDPSQLILMCEVMDLVGIVSLLYGMLLHSGAPLR
ncbi:hypothetical protein ACOMHN_016070 [Nucella lapillus]